MAFWTQLMLLLWKNFMYRKRKPVQLVIELLWPLFLFLILVAVRQSHPPFEHHECHFPNKPLPSAGMLPWFQGLLCNMNNPCYRYATPGETPVSRTECGRAGGWNEMGKDEGGGHVVSGSDSAAGSLGDLTSFQVRGSSLGVPSPVPSHTSVGLAAHLSLQLSTLPSLAELRAELRRAPGPGGPVEGVSRVLCGKSRDQGVEIPSLNWYEDDDLKMMLGWGQGRLASPMDNSTSPFCQKLIESMEAHPISRLLWWRLKPLVLGKILYTPDTPLTRRVMAEVNQTFHQLALLQELHGLWMELGPQISSFMNNSAQVALLKVEMGWQLRLPRNGTSAIRTFLGLDGSGYSWKEAHEDITLIVDKVGKVLECVSLDKLEPVVTEDSLMERAVELLGQRRFWAGVVFLGLQDGGAPGHIRLKIRMDIDDVTRTNKIKDRFWDPGPAADPILDMRYVWGGFVYLQDLLEGAVIRVLNSSAHPASIYLQQMPYPCYVDDVFLRVLNRSLPLFLTLAWIYSVALTVKGIVQEKEARLRDTMLAMGLDRSVLWGSWFVSSLVPFLVSSSLLVLILKQGDILPHSDPFPVFLFLAAFAVATICQSFLFSAAFSRANVAAACGGLLYFTLYLPYVLCVAWRDHLPPALRLAASLLSPVAFGFGCEYFSLYEEQGVGIQWHNMGRSPVAGDGYNLALCEALLILDAGLYATATWYIEAICPGQYGIPQPWNFPFRKSYWCGELASASLDPTPSKDDPQVLVEDPSPGLQVGVSLQGLVKYYPGSARPALQGLSLDFYEGHITAFLGHNGAGKTTTLSILSGLFPPTRGSALILGQDISSNRAAVHRHLGLCPQHNVLFDILTVEEHIWFYGRLKGLSRAAVGQELPRLLQDVGLPHKRQEQTRHLSGGMQRKLSVAIAFVGGSRVVILDEPTAGVDPFSRRAIWELLLKYRQGRTVILSTHYMDEAELLGDRVAVIAGGQLRCCGSPLFLKSRLGSGYYLTLVKHRPTALLKAEKVGTPAGSWGTTHGSEGPSISFCPDVAQLLALVQSLVPGAQLVEELGHEVVLTLPYSGAHDGVFGELFRELDRRLVELGISGYGISDTTLEEVEKAASRLGSRSPGFLSPPHPAIALHRELGTSGRVQGWALTRQQLRALFTKRFLHARRSRRGLFAQIVLPAFFVGLALFFSLIVPPFGHYPPLELQPAMYGSQVSFFSEDDPGNLRYAQLLNALLSEPSFQGSCGKNNSDCARPANHSFWVPPVSETVARVFATGNWTLQFPSPACQCSSPGARKMLPDCPEAAGGLPPPQMRLGPGDVVQNLTGRNISDYLVKTYPRVINQGNITTLNHPLSLTKEQLSEATLMASSVDVLVSVCVLFAMSFVPASFVLFLIEDRVSCAKHLQFLGGLPPTLYWLGNFAWDMCNYMVPAALVVLIFLGFQQQAYVAPRNLPALLLLLLLYGWSITPLMYPASFLFSVPSTAYVVLTCLNLFIGINSSVATFVLELFSNQKLKDVSWILKRVFLIFPHFCLGRGLIDMVRNQAMADAFLRLGDEQSQSPLSWELVGKNLFAMGLQGPVFLLLTLLLQHRGRLLPRSARGRLGEEDEDVGRERERVRQGATQGDVLVLKDLTKIYRGQKKPAVDHVCVGIPPGECFGLLGVNGAGKTSTFRMVTGDTPISGGEAILMGCSDLQAAQTHMGYCPQFDAITELLTGREHLEFFSRLRGVPEGEVAQVAQWGLTRLGLLQYADQPSGSYSGGNKRKLSTAIALVGGPPVIFLDEPTTGMDPGARRCLWNSVLAVVREGRCVVLTSHSMEECEALCTRLAIMVNGRFRCLGSAQHLKNRFGEGYTVSLRVPTSHPGPAQDFMEASFPGALLKEHHGCLLRYQLPTGHCPLARLFSELATHSSRLGIEDFSVTQTTLDQVFVYFAKDQGEEDSPGKPASPCPGSSSRIPDRVSCFLEDTSVAESLV
uniref:ATP binding cassette subfamily A member 7 n=1 Tax=Vombatus ursinus TaxID=29139 RepID=A0A4X2KQE6_VOMUR